MLSTLSACDIEYIAHEDHAYPVDIEALAIRCGLLQNGRELRVYMPVRLYGYWNVFGLPFLLVGVWLGRQTKKLRGDGFKGYACWLWAMRIRRTRGGEGYRRADGGRKRCGGPNGGWGYGDSTLV